MKDEQDDRPTVPSLRPYEDAGERGFGVAPTWPVASGSAGARRSSTRDVLPLVLGVSLGANVALLVGLVGVLLLARAGSFAPPRSSGQSPPAGAATTAALSSPSPTPHSGWLQVAPSSVRLGCGNGQRTQFVVLANSGPQDVQWQVDLSGAPDQAAVVVDPDHGDLRAGASMVLQIHSNTDSGSSSGSSQQGVIRFDPSTPDAGTPPSLSYTSMVCQ